MIITVMGLKGGVGKTTTAIHLARLLNDQSPTLLVDADLNRSALEWSRRGDLGFTVLDEKAAFKAARQYENVVIDTAARPEESEIKAIADGCDLLILPITPDALSVAATVPLLPALKNTSYKLLLTLVPPSPNRSGEQTAKRLTEAGLPLYTSRIRRFECFKKAALDGVTVDRVSDRNAGIAYRCYQDLVQEIMDDA